MTPHLTLCKAAFIKEAISSGALRRALANRQSRVILKQLNGTYGADEALRNQKQFTRVLSKMMNRKTLRDGRMIPITAGTDSPGGLLNSSKVNTRKLLRPYKGEVAGKDVFAYDSADGFTTVFSNKPSTPWDIDIPALYHKSAPSLTSSRTLQTLPNTPEAIGSWQEAVYKGLSGGSTQDMPRFTGPGQLKKYLLSKLPSSPIQKDPLFFRLKGAMNTFQQAAPDGFQMTTTPGNPQVHALYNRINWANKEPSKMIIKPNLPGKPFQPEADRLNRSVFGELPEQYNSWPYSKRLGDYLADAAVEEDAVPVINRFFKGDMSNPVLSDLKNKILPYHKDVPANQLSRPALLKRMYGPNYSAKTGVPAR
jgi:hypothetical protein